ncbi:group-specific protein [Halobacillus shinanisalinarum]|uniref:Group-specific protein n=1 Tax=Halobacillus shinanisalinarum TaxID=2932258 RepID=A0ABY4GVJ0_9BACI|nr:group-specific protein [Halobacillus shinanisalinarum]UOQ92049.1 group-specific protein [Halobacillus shinanisalinarum]
MRKCNIDHSQEDVVNKLESQKEFLPNHLADGTRDFLQKEHSQETLNDLFHLLKKYDLSSESEQKERNEAIEKMIAS